MKWKSVCHLMINLHLNLKAIAVHAEGDSGKVWTPILPHTPQYSWIFLAKPLLYYTAFFWHEFWYGHLTWWVFQGIFCFQSLVPEHAGVSEDEEKDFAAKPLRLHPGPLLIGSCSGFMETTVKIKQNDMLPGPRVCCFPQAFCVTLNILSVILIPFLFSTLSAGAGW